VHAGAVPDSATGARAVPIYQSTSFVFTDTADAANLFALQKYGNIYTRIANPTVAALEDVLARLEDAEGVVAFGSGMAAIHAATLALGLAPGGYHLVVARFEPENHVDLIVDGGVSAEPWRKLLPNVWFYDEALMTTAMTQSAGSPREWGRRPSRAWPSP